MDHICEVNGVKKDENGALALNLNTLIQYDSKDDEFKWVAKDFKREEIFIEDGGWQT